MVGTLPYFPKISFFLNAVKFGCIQIQPELPYDRRLHLNRMVIPGSNGLINLSIPILGGRNNKARVDEIMIDNRYHWQRDHYRSISSVYGKSPFFVFYAEELKSIYDTPVSGLMQWNLICTEWMLKKLKSAESLKIRQFSRVDNFPKDYSESIKTSEIEIMKYPQVFESEIGFQSDVSALDILFNLGTPNGLKIIGLMS